MSLSHRMYAGIGSLRGGLAIGTSLLLLASTLVFFVVKPTSAVDLPRNTESELIVDCNVIFGYAIDRNNPDETLRYKIFVLNSSGYKEVTIQKFTDEDGTFNDGMDGQAVFGGASSKRFLLRIYESTDFNEDGIGIADVFYDASLDCASDYRPSLDLGMSCEAVSIGNMYDKNMGVKGLRYQVVIYDNRGANQKGPLITYDGFGSTNLDFYYIYEITQDSLNDGFTAYIRISNVTPDGRDVRDGGTGASPGQRSPIYDETGGLLAMQPGDYGFKRDVGPCPPPSPPPLVPPAATCEQFRHNMRKDDPASNGAAYYRITIYPRNDPSIPGDQTITPRSSRGDWAALPPGAVYQTGWLGGYPADPKGGNFVSVGGSSPSKQADGISSYDPARNPSFILNYPEPAGPDWIVVLEKWDHTADRNGNVTIDWEYRRDKLSYTNCYSASCEVRVANGAGLPANGVFGGQWFQVTARIINTGLDDLPATSRGKSLSATAPAGNWGSPTPNYGFSNIPRGSWREITYNLYAPADVASRAYSPYPDYYGLFALGPNCPPVTINTYMPFDITPTAFITSIDEEDPRKIDYTVGGNNAGWPVSINWDRQLYRKRLSTPNTTLDGVFSGASTFGNIIEPRSYGNNSTSLVPNPLQAGDQVCAWASISPTNGWVGPGNDIRLASTKPENPAENCSLIADKPYVRSYGADVMVGSGFATGGVCNVSGSSIKAFRSSFPDRSGSGTQYAAIAYNQIAGFSSASLRTPSPPMAPVGLSFGNDPPPPGHYGPGQTICATDFFGENMYPIDNTTKRVNRSNSSAPKIDNGLFPDGRQTVYSSPGSPNYTLKIDGTFGSFKNKHTIFVDGDLVITDDIVLDGWTDNDPLKAPALAIIVRGNIFIDRAVTQLDGMYVAQPKLDGSKGTIYTCTSENSLFALGDAYINACKTQLTINGAFVAKNVEFLRTYKSLRDSAPRERAGDCSGANDPANSCAAELFRFTPELYLSPPPLYREGPPPYQSYSTLPPIL